MKDPIASARASSSFVKRIVVICGCIAFATQQQQQWLHGRTGPATTVTAFVLTRGPHHHCHHQKTTTQSQALLSSTTTRRRRRRCTRQQQESLQHPYFSSLQRRLMTTTFLYGKDPQEHPVSSSSIPTSKVVVDGTVTSSSSSLEEVRMRRKLTLQSSSHAAKKEGNIISRTISFTPFWNVTVWEWEKPAAIVETYWQVEQEGLTIAKTTTTKKTTTTQKATTSLDDKMSYNDHVNEHVDSLYYEDDDAAFVHEDFNHGGDTTNDFIDSIGQRNGMDVETGSLQSDNHQKGKARELQLKRSNPNDNRKRSPPPPQRQQQQKKRNHQVATTTNNDHELETTENETSPRILDPFGLVTWPGSVVACLELAQYPNLVRDKRVLILGAGVGLEAQAAAMLGAYSVMATDIHPTTLQLLQYGAKEAGLDHIIDIAELDIMDHTHQPLSMLGPFDLMIVADVLYNDVLAHHIVRRIAESRSAASSSSSPPPIVLVSDSQRFAKTFQSDLQQALREIGDTIRGSVAWVSRWLPQFTGSGVLINDDQTYDVKARILWVGDPNLQDDDTTTSPPTYDADHDSMSSKFP